MKVIPLTYTICNWPSFSGFFNAVKPGVVQGAQSDTDFGKIATILAKLKGTKPNYDLFHLTVGVECDRRLLNHLYDLQLFKISAFDCEEFVLGIMNASLQVWKQACVDNCLSNRPKAIRQFFNEVFLLMETGAKDSVMELHKVMFEDGTFGFRNRY